MIGESEQKIPVYYEKIDQIEEKKINLDGDLKKMAGKMEAVIIETSLKIDN